MTLAGARLVLAQASAPLACASGGRERPATQSPSLRACCAGKCSTVQHLPIQHCNDKMDGRQRRGTTAAVAGRGVAGRGVVGRAIKLWRRNGSAQHGSRDGGAAMFPP